MNTLVGRGLVGIGPMRTVSGLLACLGLAVGVQVSRTANARQFVGGEPIVLDAPASDLAVLDVNGDERDDFVIAHSTLSGVSVVAARSEGGFDEPVRVPTGLGPNTLLTAKFDDDAHDDLFVVNGSSSSVSVLFGDGAGGFEPSDEIRVDPQPFTAVVGDFDGNGTTDALVVGSRASSARRLVGDGQRGLSSDGSVALGAEIASLASVDLNGDGRSDLVASFVDRDDVAVLAASADGEFEAAGSVALDTPALDLSVADIDADGHPDLVTLEAERVSVFRGNGFSMAPAGDQASSPGESFMGPLTLRATDGELVVSFVVATDDLYVLRTATWRGAGRVETARELVFGATPPSVALWRDADRDGRVDLVLGAERARQIVFHPGREDGSVARRESVSLDIESIDIEVVDLDDDGDVDCVLRGSSELQFVATSGDVFVVEPVIPLPVIPGALIGFTMPYRSMAILDLEGDGTPDVSLVASNALSIGLREGRIVQVLTDGLRNAVTTFELIPTGSEPVEQAVGDFDGDGIDDLAFSDLIDPVVEVSLGAPKGQAGRGLILDVGDPQLDVLAVDVDGNELADLVTGMPGTLAVWWNDGDAQFREGPRIEAGNGREWTRLEPADFDADGTLDVAAGFDAGVSCFFSVEEGDLDVVDIDLAGPVRAFAPGDVDGDGFPDVVALHGSPARLSFARNADGRTFELVESYAVDSGARDLALTDVDGDGHIDCIVAEGTEVAIFRGTARAEEDGRLRRGDTDQSGDVNLTDAIRVLGFLFLGDDDLPCEDAADANDDGALNLTDPVAILSFLFLEGVAPSPPGPKLCGVDPTDDALAPCSGMCE